MSDNGHQDEKTFPKRPDPLPLTRSSTRALLSNIRTESVQPQKGAQRATVWTESMLEALEPHEHDFQEFKGSGWLMRGPGDIQPDFMYYLSKQASAFSNGSGGILIIGVNDAGEVDGGVPHTLKGGTRAWLEDLIAACVDPPLPACNVFEVNGRTDGPTRIPEGQAVYVIEIAASPDAPHQAKDHRYYLRIAGKSRPMGHVHVQDVLRRTFHPHVDISRFGPYGPVETDETDPRGRRAFIRFRAFLANRGRTLARHVGIELVVPRPFAGTEVRRRMTAEKETHYTQTSGELTYFRYHPTPVFPSQELYAVSIFVCVHKNNLAQILSGAEMSWVVYADDARPIRGGQALKDFHIVQEALQWVEGTNKTGSQ